ncbi:DUF4405 domain-containing protein [Actimicrobium antarcticum]|uniref:DUF4405 domain-containing protein n=1 Tax=Actimicrobium antarcticum TaxID=1051899 RepID=A0ABP7TTE9_9BURK
MNLPKHSLHHPSRATPAAGIRLERWQRQTLYWSVIALTVSGLLWVVAHYFLRPVTEFGESVSPYEPWSMKLHGAAAMAVLFLAGSLLNGHILRALRGTRNRTSGWAMIGLLGVLVLTGYGLYYLAGEASRPAWSVLHWVLGIGFAAGLPLHIVLGRSAQSRRRDQQTG